MGLFDAYLIKENHIAAAGGITESVLTARQHNPNIEIEIEVQTVPQLIEAIEAAVDIESASVAGDIDVDDDVGIAVVAWHDGGHRQAPKRSCTQA